ncbi:hypothetical protein JFT70_05510 [Bacillus sp. TH11]|nr:hypothetical protein [Bacillus sp. TH11]
MSAVLSALKALVSKIPFSKVAAFLAWAGKVAAAMANKSAAQVAKVVAYIKNNPGKVVTAFVNGTSIAKFIIDALSS